MYAMLMNQLKHWSEANTYRRINVWVDSHTVQSTYISKNYQSKMEEMETIVNKQKKTVAFVATKAAEFKMSQNNPIVEQINKIVPLSITDNPKNTTFTFYVKNVEITEDVVETLEMAAVAIIMWESEYRNLLDAKIDSSLNECITEALTPKKKNFKFDVFCTEDKGQRIVAFLKDLQLKYEAETEDKDGEPNTPTKAKDQKRYWD